MSFSQLGQISGLLGYGSSQSPDAQRNMTPELQAQRWALREKQYIRETRRNRRQAKIEARKVRAAEYRKTKPRRRYKDL